MVLFRRMAVAIAILAIGSVFAASPAYASSPPTKSPSTTRQAAPTSKPQGWYGQQILFYDDRGDTYRVCVVGTNQYDQPETACWNTPGHATNFTNWWWHGTTYLQEYDWWGNLLRTQSTDVPLVQPGQDWWCFSDAGSGSGWGCT